MAQDKKLQLDEHIIKLKVQMDNLVEDIREVEMQLLELEELFKRQRDNLTIKFEEKRLGLTSKKDRLTQELKILFEQVPQTETKTQRKVTLLNGDVVVKKPREDFEKDNDKLLEWAKANGREELIVRKEVLSFKWADFKKNLLSTPSGIVDLETGEALDIQGLVAIRKAEELVIK